MITATNGVGANQAGQGVTLLDRVKADVIERVFNEITTKSGENKETRERSARAEVARLMSLLGKPLHENLIQHLAPGSEDNLKKLLDGKLDIESQLDQENKEKHRLRMQASLLLAALLQHPLDSRLGQQLWGRQPNGMRFFQSNFLPLVFQAAKSPNDAQANSGQGTSNNGTNGTTLARTDEDTAFYSELFSLASKVRHIISDDLIRSLWRKIDQDGARPATALNSYKDGLKLIRAVTLVNCSCQPDDITALLKTAVKNDPTDISKLGATFTKEEWLFAILSLKKSATDTHALGNLLRREDVFNFVYGIIHQHAQGQQSTAKTPPPSGNGAPNVAQQIRNLAANALRLLEDKDIEAIWKKRDGSGLKGAALLNDPCCKIFGLEGETTITNSPCSLNDLVDLVKNHSQAQGIISKFTKRELLVAVINTNKSSDGNKLGDLLREPLVFNWLFGLINDHARPEVKIQEEVHQHGEQEKNPSNTTVPTDKTIQLMDMSRKYIDISPEIRAANNPQVTIDAFEYFVNNNPDAQAFADVLQTPQDIVEFLELVFASASNSTVQIALKEEGNLEKLLNALKAKNILISSNSTNDTTPTSTTESNVADITQAPTTESNVADTTQAPVTEYNDTDIADSSLSSTKHRGKESLGERFGTEISAAVTLLKEIFPDIQLTSQIFNQIVSRISRKPNTPPAVLLNCAKELVIKFPDGRRTTKKPVLTEEQLNQVLNSTVKKAETHDGTDTNPNGQQVSAVAQASNSTSSQSDIEATQINEPLPTPIKLEIPSETKLIQMFTDGFERLQTSLSATVEDLRSNILQLAKTNAATGIATSLEEKLTTMLETGLRGIQETISQFTQRNETPAITKSETALTTETNSIETKLTDILDKFQQMQNGFHTAIENLEGKISQLAQRNETSTPVTTITNGETEPPKSQPEQKRATVLHQPKQTPSERNLEEAKRMLKRLSEQGY